MFPRHEFSHRLRDQQPAQAESWLRRWLTNDGVILPIIESRARVDRQEHEWNLSKLLLPTAERKHCVCGATLCMSCTVSSGHLTELSLCSRQCGARGLSYEGALRRKIRLDLLSWGDLRRNAQALIGANSDDNETRPLQ